MTYRSLLRVFSSDLAIDLGTANTLVYIAGKGIVLNEPSIVAVNRTTGEIVGCGTEAKEMLGRTPANVVAIRPLRDGVIADFKMAERMLNYFIHKAHKRKSLVHPRIVIGVPSETTEVKKGPSSIPPTALKRARCISSNRPWSPRLAPDCPLPNPAETW